MKKNKSTIPLLFVNIQPEGTHIFVDGKIAKQKVRLIIDTGASKTTIDKNFVEQYLSASALEKNDQPAIGIGSSQIESEFMQLPLLRLGDWKIKNWLVAVMDLTIVNDAYKTVEGPVIHGIIGSDLLLFAHAKIDFRNEKLMLKHRSVKPDTVS